jgi:hypothetical protein
MDAHAGAQPAAGQPAQSGAEPGLQPAAARDAQQTLRYQ